MQIGARNSIDASESAAKNNGAASTVELGVPELEKAKRIEDKSHFEDQEANPLEL